LEENDALINFESQSTFHPNPPFMRQRFSGIALVLGLILLTYMVTVEDEPGALPLLLILSGIAGLLWNKLTTLLQSKNTP
jgi:succinate dehydrogenase hydrophobic anchor subunit